MKAPAQVPQLRDYLLMLRDGWAVVLCVTALSALAGWISWQTSTPLYQTTTAVFLTTPGSATPSDAYFGQLAAVSRATTYQELAKSGQVTARLIEQLGLTDTPGELAVRIGVPPTTSSAIFEIVLSGDDPARLSETADAVTTNLVQLAREMAAVDTAGSELVQVGPAGPAERQGSYWQFIGRGAAFGLPLALVLVLAQGLLRDTMLGTGQVGRVVGEAVAKGNE